ncbi:hypothetical protein HDV00_005899 [Rhizophlyctis rosea]|nr:hypothetical protein HDV00_005899 [Rhizophlyctis rosea]
MRIETESAPSNSLPQQAPSSDDATSAVTSALPPPPLNGSNAPSGSAPLPSSSSELTAFALTTLFAPRTSIAEAMANLSPTQLQLLERSVERVKQLRGQDVEKLAQKVSSNNTPPQKTTYPPYVPTTLPASPGAPHLPPMSKQAAEAFAAALMQHQQQSSDPRAVMNIPYQPPAGLPVQSMPHMYAPLLGAAYSPLGAQSYAQAILQAQSQPQQPGSSAQSPAGLARAALDKAAAVPNRGRPNKPSQSPSSATPTTANGKPPKTTMPGTVPQHIEVRDGVEWVTFSYTVKLNTKVYTIRTDIDTVKVDELPEDFRKTNCVYPRADVPRDEYKGNRWDYETSVNDLGWKLSFLNKEALSGRRGLIQRAVDSVRNRFSESRSRRVVRQEKLIKGTLRKRPERPHDLDDAVPNLKRSSPSPTDDDPSSPSKRLKTEIKSIEFESIYDGTPIKTRIRVDVDSIALEDIPEDFRVAHAVFPRALVVGGEALTGRMKEVREREERCNEWGWKLAWLNEGLRGRKVLLQRGVDAFRQHFTGVGVRRGKGIVEEGLGSGGGRKRKGAAGAGRRGSLVGGGKGGGEGVPRSEVGVVDVGSVADLVQAHQAAALGLAQLAGMGGGYGGADMMVVEGSAPLVSI